MTKYTTKEEAQAARQKQRRERYERDKAAKAAANAARAKLYYEEHKEEIKAKMRARAKVRSRYNGQGTWIVEADPAPYGLIPGAQISASEKEGGLQFGTFTPGTVLRYMDARFQVIGEVDTHQKLRMI